MIRGEAARDDPQQLRAAYSCFPSGLAAICALAESSPVGLVASSFTSVSLNPPLVSVCIQNSSTTWPLLRGRDHLGVSILAEGQQLQCRALSLKIGNRFADVDWNASAHGAVFVEGSVAWFECTLHGEVPAGDHLIALLEIHSLQADPEASPLVFHASQLRRLAATSST
ncbi:MULTISPECIES: flavin reductase family protein [unclassified Mycobacterium]|uniref:flavin reductase family protein n=1 Tax=unclassified Mycobacterium TaxID=2642494 RepID=UPI0029C6E230|nr:MULTISPECIES: flavin reductase family protein [unclassified Mycobacterium]